jgi:CHASE2 domain-containing sensor protein
MNARKDAPPPSPFARSVGAAMASLVLALLICGFTFLLRAVDFAPLRALVMTEDHLYDAIHAPDVRLLKNAHQVVFIDIDDNAVEKWTGRANKDLNSSERPKPSRNNTPHGLIAELAGLARKASAAVVFLDFDFRDRLADDIDRDGDRSLHDELAKKSDTPVLIPTFFTAGVLPPCVNQSDQIAPAELETVFSDLTEAGQSGSAKELPSVALVHPVLALGAYGLPEGACSAYHVQFGGEMVAREAAMVRAVELAIAGSPCEPAEQCVKLPGLDTPEIVPIRWAIGNDTDQKHDGADSGGENDGKRNLAYARVKASSLVTYQGLVDSPKMDSGVLKDAIVVIGSTARWSEDTLSTPLGNLQGVLAHVNLALSLESANDEIPLWEQFGLDVVFIAAAAAAVPLVWYYLYKKLGLAAEPSARQQLWHFLLETGLFVVFGIVFAAICALLLYSGSRLTAGWRFGLLTFVVGSIVALLIEVCSAVSEGARKATEHCMTRRTTPNPESSPRLEPPNASAKEAPPR